MTQLRGFVALATHEAAVAVPVAFWVLARHTDWALSYVADGAKVPSAALLVASLACGALGLVGFALGAWWIRAHQPRRPGALAIGLAAAGVVGGGALADEEGPVRGGHEAELAQALAARGGGSRRCSACTTRCSWRPTRGP